MLSCRHGSLLHRGIAELRFEALNPVNRHTAPERRHFFRNALRSLRTMQAHPLIPPHIAPGCWPEATAEDKKNALANLKQQRMMQSGMESVVVKGAISAGAGTCFFCSCRCSDAFADFGEVGTRLTVFVPGNTSAFANLLWGLRNDKASLSGWSSVCSPSVWRMTHPLAPPWTARRSTGRPS